MERYSNFDKLLRVTARVLLLYQRTPKPSFQTAGKPFIPLDVTKAEHFWIMEAQRNMHADIKKANTNVYALEKTSTEYTWLEDEVKDGLR